MDKPKDISTTEAGILLGVSSRTITEWYKDGNFPNAYKLNPGKRNSPLRIPMLDIERFEMRRIYKRRIGYD